MIDLFPGAPFNDIVVLDFETRWSSKDYTLSKMTTESYIRDPRFKAFGVSMKRLGHDAPIAQWYSHDELPRIFGTYDWSKTAVVAHNAQFDVGIMEWVYDVHPVFIFDTLSMARALFGTEVGNSLKKLSEAFGLPPKGNAVHNTDGLDELDPEVERELAAYCCHDTELASILFAKLLMRTNPYTGHVAGLFPIKELRLIDMTCKMFTRPQLHLDSKMLEEAIDDEQTKRESLLQRLGVTDSMLASAEQFGALLRQLNVEPPTKPSPTNPNKLIPALAKSDAKFQALLNSDNDDVAALCEARLKVKSTQERTRAQRFLDISRRGVLPVPLAYYGAATGRWAASKGAAINMQNMKRGSFLRKAIMAPEGHVLVVGDLSQIEPRVLAWLADYEALLDIFRSGQDAYAMFGRQMFNKPDLTKETDPDLRQSAKSALLGAGFGLGWASFAQQLLTGFLGAPPMRYDKAFAKKLGVTGDWAQRFLSWERNQEAIAGIAANCTQEQLVVHCMAAARIIEIYRDTASPVTSFWDVLSGMIDRCLYGGDEMTYKCLTFRKDEILLPNGMSLRYPNLRLEKDKDDPKGRMQYIYDDGRGASKLYAGRATNNCVQSVARIIMTDGMLRVARRYFVAATVHDELVAVVPENEAQEAKAWVLEQMIKEPAYLPGIPLAAEVGVHRRYGLAKG